MLRRLAGLAAAYGALPEPPFVCDNTQCRVKPRNASAAPICAAGYYTCAMRPVRAVVPAGAEPHRRDRARVVASPPPAAAPVVSRISVPSVVSSLLIQMSVTRYKTLSPREI